MVDVVVDFVVVVAGVMDVMDVVVVLVGDVGVMDVVVDGGDDDGVVIAYDGDNSVYWSLIPWW